MKLSRSTYVRFLFQYSRQVRLVVNISTSNYVKNCSKGRSNDMCPPTEDKNLCGVRNGQLVIICGRGFPEYYAQKNDFVRILSICYWPNELFNTSDVLSLFPNIQKFTFSRSNTTKILEDFPAFSTLKVLNITYTSIEYLKMSVFYNLNQLEVLDLRHNKLRIFNPNLVAYSNNLKLIFLANNSYSCGDNFSWITFENYTFNKLIVDAEDMLCGGPRYQGKPLKRIMGFIETLKGECHKDLPIDCTCSLEHVVIDNKIFRPLITVNCSHQHLTELPSKLPTFTSTLILSGNMISNLSEFITNESYSKLLQVYLDYNIISSINTLAASTWLTTFRALSLMGNRLSEMPIFSLENVLAKNGNIARLMLSENPWKCDCAFFIPFKNFLAKYKSVVKDLKDVRCAQKDGDENSLIPIISLNRSKICKEKTTFKLSYVNFLSICFSVLLIALFIDFGRNYYMYKKYSKLPWMVRKLPC